MIAMFSQYGQRLIPSPSEGILVCAGDGGSFSEAANAKFEFTEHIYTDPRLKHKPICYQYSSMTCYQYTERIFIVYIMIYQS